MHFLLLIASLVSFTVLNAETVQHFPEPLKKSEEYELFKTVNLCIDENKFCVII